MVKSYVVLLWLPGACCSSPHTTTSHRHKSPNVIVAHEWWTESFISWAMLFCCSVGPLLNWVNVCSSHVRIMFIRWDSVIPNEWMARRQRRAKLFRVLYFKCTTTPLSKIKWLRIKWPWGWLREVALNLWSEWPYKFCTLKRNVWSVASALCIDKLK